MEPAYQEATNHNLPVVDSTMVFEFYRKHPDFDQPEVRNIKASRATRESYGDNAVGYVQVKREGNTCSVKGKLTPEHKVHKAAYMVQAIIDEENEIVKECKCLDCSASAGSCKHSIAFLLWLHRRSEEQSVTSVECYWKRSKLAKVGTSTKFATLKDLCDKAIPPLPDIACIQEKSFRKSVMEKGKTVGSSGALFQEDFPTDPVNKVCLHKSVLKYMKENDVNDYRTFMDFLGLYITKKDCEAVEHCTRKQSKNPDWFRVRYGRITASKLYEASKCSTLDGSLVTAILGGSKPISTPAIERGKLLEIKVLEEVSRRCGKIESCGFYIYPNVPVFGASPDGITGTHAIEVKCPSKDKTMKNYISDDGKLCSKPMAQIQLQMFLAAKRKGYFCVAAPDFESTKNVKIVQVELDLKHCAQLIKDSLLFWKKAIFPNLLKHKP